ncbi:fimbria/pilus outer membrane usher protein [Providencia stuartii]|uniref:fimbria/pilus outer membrane usher protein n=1 Tax=Providencia TaxID=586 RepID=UPI0034D4CB20
MMMKKNNITLLMLFLITTPLLAYAEYFNLEALDNIENINDIENIILNLDNQPEGIYAVDVIVNNVRLFTENVSFQYIDQQLVPIFSRNQLLKIGLHEKTLNTMTFDKNDNLASHLSTIIEGYSHHFDFNHLTLDINIPHHYLNSDTNENNLQSQWDDGVTSAYIDYNLSGSYNSNKYINDNNSFNLSLQNGINYLGWRLRNNLVYSNSHQQWESYNTTLSYPIRSLKSQFILGEYYLASSFFIPYSFKGISLSNDELMFPDYDAYYSPILQGINHSPAQVTVRQNNIIIYNDYLPAGPFTLNQLKPLAHKGVLEMTITESSGRVRQYQYPFSSSPLMIKKGQFRYALNSGMVSNRSRSAPPYFFHSEIKYGINNNITAYTGSIFSSPFKSLILGSSFSANEIGDLTIDWTQSYSQKNKSNSYQFEYSKLITPTATEFTFNVQWTDNPKLRQFTDVLDKINLSNTAYPQQIIKLHLSQGLGYFGNISLSASQQRFREQRGYQWAYNLNYSGNINEYHFSLNCQSNYSIIEQKPEYIFSASIIIPVNAWLPNTHFSYQSQYAPNNYQSQQATLTGAILEDNFISYTLQHNSLNNRCCMRPKNESDTRFYTQYHHNKFILNAGYGYKQEHQLHYGFRSSVVAHPYGITLTPSRGETSALLVVPDTQDVRLDAQLNTNTDSKGHAIINQLQPYRRNNFVIDTQTLPVDTEIETSFQSILPTKGALVLVHFPVKRGKRSFFTIRLADGKLAPFGALASLVTEKGELTSNDINVGIINDMGQVYLTGLEPSGTIKLKWGAKQSQQCEFQYQLLETDLNQGFYHVPVICQRKEAL